MGMLRVLLDNVISRLLLPPDLAPANVASDHGDSPQRGESDEEQSIQLSEEQSIAVPKQLQGGHSVTELSHEYRVSTATVYVWKSQDGGLDVHEARRLHQLEAENRKLNPLV